MLAMECDQQPWEEWHSSSVGKGPKRLVCSSLIEPVELVSIGIGSVAVAPLVISRDALTLVVAAIVLKMILNQTSRQSRSNKIQPQN